MKFSPVEEQDCSLPGNGHRGPVCDLSTGMPYGIYDDFVVRCGAFMGGVCCGMNLCGSKWTILAQYRDFMGDNGCGLNLSGSKCHYLGVSWIICGPK
jgi:hypothetical protein